MNRATSREGKGKPWNVWTRVGAETQEKTRKPESKFRMV